MLVFEPRAAECGSRYAMLLHPPPLPPWIRNFSRESSIETFQKYFCDISIKRFYNLVAASSALSLSLLSQKWEFSTFSERALSLSLSSSLVFSLKLSLSSFLSHARSTTHPCNIHFHSLSLSYKHTHSQTHAATLSTSLTFTLTWSRSLSPSIKGLSLHDWQVVNEL